MNADEALAGTPYLMESDAASMKRFNQLLERSTNLRDQALGTSAKIAAEAKDVLGPYIEAARTELVAESNVIEGIQWTPTEAREVVLNHRELLNMPLRTMIEGVRADPRIYEVLGLYRAHEIADRWSQSDRPPLASEMRELHKTILGDARGAGEYKQFSNAISGTAHKTTEPYDVARVILEIADWWAGGTPDPILTATVVHAWFAHVHPFDDGNGRTARVLANLELARHDYPPLIIRPESDRGQYYAALAQSDDGNLLPLYDLFVNTIRRQVKLMSRPSYVLDVIADKFLASEKDRLKFWHATLDVFQLGLQEACERNGATFKFHGKPSLQSFSLLRERNSDGNSWFAEIGERGRPAMWLLWFGYQSSDYCDIAPKESRFPSIFLSVRDYDALAVHPYTADFNHVGVQPGVPEEIVVMPGVGYPIKFRTGYDISQYKSAPGGQQLADLLCLWLSV
jgi:Fic family protein